jgi:hypothetical protein
VVQDLILAPGVAFFFQPELGGQHECIKERVEERLAFCFDAPSTCSAGTDVILAVAMTAMLRPKNGLSYTFQRISVELLQPRRLEEHDLGHILRLACDDDVPLQ